MATNTRGQALLEFAIALLVLIPLLAGLGTLGLLQWNRLECAHLTFEDARRALSHAQGTSVVRERRCGSVTERVELPAIEDRRW